MAVESLKIDAWLYTVLAGDTTLTDALGGTAVYSDVAPQGASLPYVVFGQQGDHDLMGVGTARIASEAVYQVRVVGQAESYLPLQAAADRIDALLQGGSGFTGVPRGIIDGHVLACVREQTLRYADVSEGVQYRHVGGLYRIWVQ